MDESKEYIEMCEKATGDLPGIYHNWGKLDIVAMEQTVGKRDFEVMSVWQMWRSLAPYDLVDSDRLIIKLFRQDELQEMVDKKARKIVAAIKTTALPYLLTQKFYYAVCGGPVSYPPGFTSMEQLWLGFIMSEKFNKVWNGKKWIKRK